MAGLAPIAITMGEPAGIGPDLILQLFTRREELQLPPFIVFGSFAFLAARARRLGLDISLTETTAARAGDDFAVSLPVAHIDGLVPDKPGEPSALSGKVVLEAISRGVGETLAGACRAVVTAPIHKAALYKAGFKYPGHTEYVAALCGKGSDYSMPVMMMVHDDLRVAPLTIHVPLKDVPGLLTSRLIRDTVHIIDHDLRTRFGIAAPRLAITGLNPHAGESGTMGTEERDIILPTVIDLHQSGVNIEGPIAADSLFFPDNWRKYDAVVATYHDQALIPIKTVAFDQAVNITLGQPIVRTSPDHGTAFSLAGTGKGSISSMLAALRLADQLTS